MATPGHTYEHLAWLVQRSRRDEPAQPCSAAAASWSAAPGRTDLLGPEHTDALTRAQYASSSRLAALPDDVQVLPTHGAGSFCVAAMPDTRAHQHHPPRAAPTTRCCAATDLDEFRAELCGELMAYPAYYAQMAPINRAGAAGARPAPATCRR